MRCFTQCTRKSNLKLHSQLIYWGTATLIFVLIKFLKRWCICFLSKLSSKLSFSEASLLRKKHWVTNFSFCIQEVLYKSYWVIAIVEGTVSLFSPTIDYIKTTYSVVMLVCNYEVFNTKCSSSILDCVDLAFPAVKDYANMRHNIKDKLTFI